MRMDRRAGLLASAFSPADVPISYTGSYTDELVTMDGSLYRLLTLISSGTLTADAPVPADVWICGGGATGGSTSNIGGGGGFASTLMNQTIQNLVITIGAGGVYSNYTVANGGQSSISGGLSLTANGGNTSADRDNPPQSGTGGGQGGLAYTSAGTGDGVAKTPFASNYFSYPYCDGGGGGGRGSTNSSSRYKGGAGGTNGGNGGNRTTSGVDGGAGGGHYGGAGGRGTSTQSEVKGKAATGYGSGGGGGGSYSTSTTGSGGNGYQGVCFIRIPA